MTCYGSDAIRVAISFTVRIPTRTRAVVRAVVSQVGVERVAERIGACTANWHRQPCRGPGGRPARGDQPSLAVPGERSASASGRSTLV